MLPIGHLAFNSTDVKPMSQLVVGTYAVRARVRSVAAFLVDEIPGTHRVSSRLCS